MWTKTIMLTLAVITASAQDFNPNDESDYVDDPDDGVSLPSDSTMTLTPELMDISKVQGEVAKILGQSVIPHEVPGCTSLKITSKAARKTKNTRKKRKDPIEESAPTRTGSNQWSLRKAKTRRTTEAVYSINVRGWTQNKARPGVIAKLVGAHDIVHHERPTWTPADPTELGLHHSYRRTIPGHIYEYEGIGGDDGRRYLLTVPTQIKEKITTRRARPTPTSTPLVTTIRYTRKTQKHPNCTHSYYECLQMCFDRKGYKVKCPWDTPEPRPEPARLNFTGMFWALSSPITQWDTDDLFASFKEQILEKGYRDCKCTTKRTTTLKKTYPVYYDEQASNNTGKIIAKCWVCGLLDHGIPRNAHCSDNFNAEASGLALSEKNSYRKYCRYMDEVPLWYNRSDPFSVFGTWTGGCSTRYLDLSGLYTQRTCRSVTHPATGHHYLSRRMALLELALREEREGCVVSPMASLVPFSRSVSLYARLTVCVCAGNFCNHAASHSCAATLIAMCVNVVYLIRPS